MNKRERVIAAIYKKETEGVPSCFSVHFPKNQTRGWEAIKAHLRFFSETDTDIVKIMNEDFVPTVGRISSASDFDRVCRDTGFVEDQLELVKRIAGECEGDVFTTGTLHGMTASTLHPIEHSGVPYAQAREQLCAFLREDPDKVSSAMHRICDAMCELARRSIEYGLDSIYFASLGGEMRYFTDEEFCEYIAPMDKQILTAVREAGGYSILHICKDGLNMERYRSYAPYAHVVNWGVYEAPMSLTDGKAMFKNSAIMGGLKNHGGVLENGTEEEIQGEVKTVIDSVGPRGFILGADCTLPTNIDTGRIRTAVMAAREYR